MSSSSYTHSRRRRRRAIESETRAERKQRTREALLAGALALLDERAFGNLRLREVTRAAGIAPAGFYHHFDDLDELGLVLVDESFRRLRRMLRSAREGRADHAVAIRDSVAVLARHVHENRLHFRFIARERSGGVPLLRRAIRSEIRLFASELATDLVRFPVLCAWNTDDLQMLAGLMVDAVVATVEEILEAPVEDPLAEQEVLRTAERRLRLIVLAIPHWRSASAASASA
jgi:AcrR family transcriptional regulator